MHRSWGQFQAASAAVSQYLGECVSIIITISFLEWLTSLPPGVPVGVDVPVGPVGEAVGVGSKVASTQ